MVLQTIANILPAQPKPQMRHVFMPSAHRLQPHLLQRQRSDQILGRLVQLVVGLGAFPVRLVDE